jgi:hypothetical protein
VTRCRACGAGPRLSYTHYDKRYAPRLDFSLSSRLPAAVTFTDHLTMRRAAAALSQRAYAIF